MIPIILVFILRESVNRSDNPTSRRNMNSRRESETLSHLRMFALMSDAVYRSKRSSNGY